MDNLKFYIINVGGYVSIIDYATYEIIDMFNINIDKQLKEAKNCLIYLNKLNNYSYISLILKLSKSKTTTNLYKERVKDREEWIQGAWMQVTNKTLKDLKLSINIHYNKPFDEVVEEYNKVHKAMTLKDSEKPLSSTPNRKLPRKLKKRSESLTDTLESVYEKNDIKVKSITKKTNLKKKKLKVK